MKIIKYSILLFIPTTLLLGCTAQTDDLVDFTNQVRATTPVVIRPDPEFVPPEPVFYTVSDLRSPFERDPSEIETAKPTATPNCAQPEVGRPKQELESYGLDALTMSGFFTSNGKNFALIKASDGSLHKATVGNYIGLYNGRITAVSNNAITITEMLPDGAGCFKKKSASLNLSGVSGDNNNV